MMPILVKTDDVRSGRKAKDCYSRLQPAQESGGLNFPGNETKELFASVKRGQDRFHSKFEQ